MLFSVLEKKGQTIVYVFLYTSFAQNPAMSIAQLLINMTRGRASCSLYIQRLKIVGDAWFYSKQLSKEK